MTLATPPRARVLRSFPSAVCRRSDDPPREFVVLREPGGDVLGSGRLAATAWRRAAALAPVGRVGERVHVEPPVGKPDEGDGESRGEKCAKCRSVGEDRRTLWMACFYAMQELDVPFEREILYHADLKDCEISAEGLKIELPARDGLPATSLTLTPPKFRCSGDLTPHVLFTLRVCKRCRGEWMGAVKNWFCAEPEGQDRDANDEPPAGTPAGCGSGIFVREHGALKEITREEWDQRQRIRDAQKNSGQNSPE